MTYQAFRRKPVAAQQRSVSRMKTIGAPVRGWVTAASLAGAKPGQALRLENWFPTQTGVRPRGGSAKHATIGSDPVEKVFHYTGSSNKLFAADRNGIFDITSPADPDVAPTADVTLTDGYLSTSLFTTTGGTYLTVVNGADVLYRFDGAYWYPITSAALYSLEYDAQTANFTVGDTLTGGTSGATAEIVKDIDGGTTGTLWVRGITGTFQDDETITDAHTGSATSNIPSGVTALAGGAAITGIATTTLSDVWIYRNRMFFIGGGTLNSYYLSVDSIAGSLGTKALGGIFQRGGSLLFGATWSRDAGDGLNDFCVMVTTEGEVAIFQGDDPSGSSPGDFDFVGRYDISKPLGKNGYMSAGGDLLVLTEDGIVPLSAALTKDRAALSLSAVSRPIEPEWQTEVRTRSGTPWEIVKWASRNLALVSIPRPNSTSDAYCFVVNVETGAWCKYTNWDVRSADIYSDQLYFGTLDGTIYAGESGGSDDGSTIYCTYVGHAEHLDAVGVTKSVLMMRSAFSASLPFTAKLSCSKDYNITLPNAPSVATVSGVGWDLSVWDTGTWDDPAAESMVQSQWVSIGRTGFAINPQVQVSSNSTVALDCNLVTIDILYEIGGIVV